MLLRICIPDRLIWIRNGWDGKRIEEVLQHILTDQARQKLLQSIQQHSSAAQVDARDSKDSYDISR